MEMELQCSALHGKQDEAETCVRHLKGTEGNVKKPMAFFSLVIPKIKPTETLIERCEHSFIIKCIYFSHSNLNLLLT